MLLTLSAFSFSCSSDNDSSNKNEIYQKLIGKWYFQDPSVYGYTKNNSFTFSSNNHVTYSYWLGDFENTFDSETGSFNVNGDVLKMTFPDGVELVFVQKVEFINNNTVQFLQVEGSNEKPYKGTYYKAE